MDLPLTFSFDNPYQVTIVLFIALLLVIAITLVVNGTSLVSRNLRSSKSTPLIDPPTYFNQPAEAVQLAAKFVLTEEAMRSTFCRLPPPANRRNSLAFQTGPDEEDRIELCLQTIQGVTLIFIDCFSRDALASADFVMGKLTDDVARTNYHISLVAS
jgi:hypothetical protein